MHGRVCVSSRKNVCVCVSVSASVSVCVCVSVEVSWCVGSSEWLFRFAWFERVQQFPHVSHRHLR